MFGSFGSNSTITKGVISDVPKNVHHWRCLKMKISEKIENRCEKKMAKRQPIYMLKPAYNFLNHTFTSFSSTGQKVLQTCPSITKLLLNYDLPLIQWLGWNLKIVAERFWGTPPYFCWQLAFYQHLPTSGRQNTVKTAPQPLFVNRAFVALYVLHWCIKHHFTS